MLRAGVGQPSPEPHDAHTVSSPTSVMSARHGMLFAYIAGTECHVIQWMNEPGLTSPAPPWAGYQMMNELVYLSDVIPLEE